ncbi:MAG: transglycosylase SLT domain-containing protein [Rhodanobacter sp.]
MTVATWMMLAGIALVLLSVLRLVRYDLSQAYRGAVPTTMHVTCTVAMYVIGLAVLLGSAGAAQAVTAVHIPDASVRYRLQLERAAGAQWGLDAPVARVAAQIHQESAWNPSAASAYAQGLSQFTPATAAWLPTVCPSVGAADPWDAGWSIRAAICYDAWLLDRAPGATPCDRWAMTLSAYNGGEGARDRERRLATAAHTNAAVWFGAVDAQRSRSAANWRENRHYVRRILLVLEPAYIAAGWPGSAVCS